MRKLPLSILFALCLALLGLNFFVIGPILMKTSEVTANLAFIGIRVGVVFAFAFAAGYLYGRPRWDTIRLGTLLVFVDHVAFRGLGMLLHYKSHPEAYIGVEKSALLMSLGLPFVVAFPVIVILCLAGGELGRGLRAKRSPAAAQG